LKYPSPCLLPATTGIARGDEAPKGTKVLRRVCPSRGTLSLAPFDQEAGRGGGRPQLKKDALKTFETATAGRS